jgi:hypothetical protein
MTEAFRVNSPSVMHETIEGEVIVIDLTTGTYYSLRETGAAIWQAIEHEADVDGIAAAVERRYEGDPAEVRAAVAQLLAELQSEGLIARAAGVNGNGSAAAAPDDGEVVESRAPFRAPVLEKHSDMQELILLDPVHEVGAQGWPQTAAEAAKDGA